MSAVRSGMAGGAGPSFVWAVFGDRAAARAEASGSFAVSKMPVPSIRSLAGEMPVPPIRSLTGETPVPPIRSLTGETPVPPIRSLAGEMPVPPIRSLAGEMPVPPIRSLTGEMPVPPIRSLAGEMPVPPIRSLTGETPVPPRWNMQLFCARALVMRPRPPHQTRTAWGLCSPVGVGPHPPPDRGPGSRPRGRCHPY